MEFKSLINYSAIDRGMITYFNTGEQEERGTFEDLSCVIENIWSYKQEILKNKRKIKNAAREWDQEVIWDPEGLEEIPAYRNKQEYIEELKAENICYKEELIEEEEALADYKAAFHQYMDGKAYDWDKEFEKYQKWRDFLEKAEEVEEELDL